MLNHRQLCHKANLLEQVSEDNDLLSAYPWWHHSSRSSIFCVDENVKMCIIIFAPILFFSPQNSFSNPVK